MRRWRRAMDLGDGGAAAGPGPALGRGGLEALQHTGEGPRAGGEGGARRGSGAEPAPLPRPGGPRAARPALTPGLSPGSGLGAVQLWLVPAAGRRRRVPPRAEGVPRAGSPAERPARSG